MTTGGFTDVFGGTAIRPAQPSYEALTIAANTQLVWPLESTQSTPSVATQIDVTASATGLSVLMPPATIGSTGVATIMTNVGTNSFTLTDTSGNQICILTASQSWMISLTDNTTTNGTWRALQLAATTSSASAGALAGLGLQAIGSQLQVAIPTVYISANQLITSTYRATAVVWTGGTGTVTLDTIGNLTAGWWNLFTNEGTGNVTITGTGGQTINGQASLVVAPGNSGIMVCSSSGFNTFGAVLGPLSITNGGTGAATATQALTNLGGTSIGESIFTAPSASSVLALLGLNRTNLTEASVSTSQTLAQASSNTVFVCTAALTLTLPLSTTLTNNWQVAFFAYSGQVTITPQTSDTIAGQAMGASVVINQGASGYIFTDTNGNIFILFNAASYVIGTTTNDNAPAGVVGEYISSSVPSSAPMGIANGTPTNLTSISLTAGDWDVWGNVIYGVITAGASTVQAWTSTTSATVPTSAIGYSQLTVNSTAFASGTTVVIPMQRISLAVTTTVYLSTFIGFTSGGANCFGAVQARRVR